MEHRPHCGPGEDLKIHPLETGLVQIHRRQTEPKGKGPARLLATVFDRQWTGWLPVLSWAIEHQDGVVVVDAGQDPDWSPPLTDIYTRLAVRFDVNQGDRLLSRLKEAGIKPADVTHHVITHLHIDHVGGAGTIHGATNVTSATEWKAAHRLDSRFAGLVVPKTLTRVTGIHFEDESVGPFEHSHRLTGDGTVRLLPTPGHTNGHMSVLVDDGTAPRVLIAGDAVYSEAQLLRNGIDGVAINAGEAQESVERLRELCREAPTVVLPTHDPDSAARLEAMQPTGIEQGIGLA